VGGTLPLQSFLASPPAKEKPRAPFSPRREYGFFPLCLSRLMASRLFPSIARLARGVSGLFPTASFRPALVGPASSPLNSLVIPGSSPRSFGAECDMRSSATHRGLWTGLLVSPSLPP